MKTKPRAEDPAKNFSVSFPQSHLSQLESEADKTGKSRSEILLESYLLAKEKNKGIA